MKNLLCSVALVATLSACASNPDSLSTAYVSPVKYEAYSCDQLSSEMTAINQRSLELYRSLKKKRSGDNWQTGIGLILFFPSLFFLEGGDGPEAAEFSSLKGEFEALKEVNIQKSCNLNIRSPQAQIEYLYSQVKETEKELKAANQALKVAEKETAKLSKKARKAEAKAQKLIAKAETNPSSKRQKAADKAKVLSNEAQKRADDQKNILIAATERVDAARKKLADLNG
jgi:DNA repair exonuclease SbcCD ATPase subunit